MKAVDKMIRIAWLSGMFIGLAAAPQVLAQAEPGKADAKDQPPNQAAKSNPKAAGPQIEMNIALISFERKELEAVARKSPSACVAAADVLTLWRAGQGRLVTTLTAKVNPNEKFTIKDVTEWRYPQSYEPSQIAVANPKPNHEMVGSQPMTYFSPADFQTREVGMIFTFTANVGPDKKSIKFELAPEFSTHNDADDAVYKSITPAGTNLYYFPQPMIQSKSIQLVAICADGETVVYNSDLLNRDNEEGSYLLITPRVIPPRP